MPPDLSDLLRPRLHLPTRRRELVCCRWPPAEAVHRADGQPVVLWPGRSNDVGRYLVFHFGSWRMGVWDDAVVSTMTDEQLATWATHLRAG
jgi:hypothetical protein